jgi:dipeptidyl aminopeptidase/acylaminoacyl peptidase
VFFVADEAGRTPVFRVDVTSGEVTRLSVDGAFSDLCPSPDGTTLYALRSRIASPPEAMALDALGEDQEPRTIPTPGLPVTVPGRVEELIAAAPDGVAVHSWLVLPTEASAASPAPLVLWIHGGPLGSWQGWHWRWNPWVLAARGYAVLLPDPALSTGYGQAFIQRGWGRWGAEPYTDLMAAVDAAVARPDIHPERTAAMGGSFGGYMANWVAGHTDRFRAIVTHASLWAMDQFHGTTDEGQWWESEFGDPYRDPHRYEENSPHRHIGRITTPVLVIHGELDHRVPVGEALRLWTDLRRHGVPAKFLYFPDENHWILKPQHARVWYETVIAWLDQQLLGKDWERPTLL